MNHATDKVKYGLFLKHVTECRQSDRQMDRWMSEKVHIQILVLHTLAQFSNAVYQVIHVSP